MMLIVSIDDATQRARALVRDTMPEDATPAEQEACLRNIQAWAVRWARAQQVDPGSERHVGALAAVAVCEALGLDVLAVYKRRYGRAS